MVDFSEETFQEPPADLALELCLDFHLERNPRHPAFIYLGLDGETVQSCTYGEFVPAIHRAAHVLSKSLQPHHAVGCSPLTVGLIVQTDSLSYITTLAGLMRVGITAFPISYRFSSTIIAHLIEKAHPAAIIVDPSTERLAIEAINASARHAQDRPISVQLPTLASLYPGHDEFIPLPMHFRNLEDTWVFIHSSCSSSGFPNLVPWSGFAVSHHGEIEEMPKRNLSGQILQGCGLELFHSLTLCLFFMTVRKGLVLSFPNPWKHNTNKSNFIEVFRSIELIKPNFIFTNARALEGWAQSSTQIDTLRACGADIYYGGSFLSKTIGNKLVEGGVRLCTAYGSTESGPVSILPHFQGEEWEFFAVNPRPDVNFISRQDGLCELVISPTEGQMSYLADFNTIFQGRPAYNPGDLFVAHPSKPDTYKMLGRLGDQILLASGETINPIQFEAEITTCPLIASAVMFGYRRPNVGVIIEPIESLAHSEDDRNSRKGFLDSIWPSIVQANLNVPVYSRITKKMVIVADDGKPIPVSLKGLPKRALVWQVYEDEISALYRNSDQKLDNGEQ